jgi:hypothetical protein
MTWGGAPDAAAILTRARSGASDRGLRNHASVHDNSMMKNISW